MKEKSVSPDQCPTPHPVPALNTCDSTPPEILVLRLKWEEWCGSGVRKLPSPQPFPGARLSPVLVFFSFSGNTEKEKNLSRVLLRVDRLAKCQPLRSPPKPQTFNPKP